MIGAYIFGAGALGFAIVAIVAIIQWRAAERRLAERELADATAHAEAERNRAEVAERQLAEAERARKEAEDGTDAIIADGLLDPLVGWDARAGAGGGGVLPSTGAPAGASSDAATVPNRRPGADPGAAVAPAAAVPPKPARS